VTKMGRIPVSECSCVSRDVASPCGEITHAMSLSQIEAMSLSQIEAMSLSQIEATSLQLTRKIDKIATGSYTKYASAGHRYTVILCQQGHGRPQGLMLRCVVLFTASQAIMCKSGVSMPKAPGNTMRPSAAKDDGQPINNLPGLYPTEDWVVYYWDVEPQAELRSRRAVIQLPHGYADACPEVWIGGSGCVHNVRRWGVQCYTRILQDIGFDPSIYLAHDVEQFPSSEDEVISILINATHFDLPAHFVIASVQHPLLLFDPQGILKGSYTRWHTYLGALAYMFSNGKVNGYFGRLHAENRALYNEALTYVLQALQQSKA